MVLRDNSTGHCEQPPHIAFVITEMQRLVFMMQVCVRGEDVGALQHRWPNSGLLLLSSASDFSKRSSSEVISLFWNTEQLYVTRAGGRIFSPLEIEGWSIRGINPNIIWEGAMTSARFWFFFFHVFSVSWLIPPELEERSCLMPLSFKLHSAIRVILKWQPAYIVCQVDFWKSVYI